MVAYDPQLSAIDRQQLQVAGIDHPTRRKIHASLESIASSVSSDSLTPPCRRLLLGSPAATMVIPDLNVSPPEEENAGILLCMNQLTSVEFTVNVNGNDKQFYHSVLITVIQLVSAAIPVIQFTEYSTHLIYYLKQASKIT